MTIAPGTLLLVDDEELNRDMLSRRFQLHGFTVTCAEGGRQALDLVGRHSFDLVLLDMMMPEMNGMQVLQELRGSRPPAELPVIMVTANHASKDMVEAFRLGANDYVTKPVDFPVALARVNAQLSCKRAQEALRQSEMRYALAARGANDGLWDWDLVHNTVYYSPRWKAMLGFEEDEIGDSPDEWLGRVHLEDLPHVRAALDAHREGRTPHYETEHRMLHRDTSYRWVLARGLVVRDDAGRPLRMAGSQTDITGSKVSDALTGLPNRVLFQDRLGRALARARRQSDYSFAVLFLDLDRFKVINDSLGHQAGDQLLVAIARKLESCLRGSDTVSRLGEDKTVARLGGDEFAILLDGLAHPDDAAVVAGRIQQELAAPFLLGGNEVYCSVSIGIVTGEAGYAVAEELLRDADTALYSAKAQGRARYEVFDAAMRARAVARLQTETDLRRGIDRHELRLHYQPILSLDSDQVCGFEALVRWQHPERGLLYPGDFIHIAEDTGLIVPLGWWVLREACLQMRAWRERFGDDPPLRMSVNLSSKQLQQPDLVAQVAGTLEETGLPAASLKLEITESAIIHDPDAAASLLAQLRGLGVEIGLDDFGTGYSSFSYLHRFPIDTLKIDRSFVDQMGTAEKAEIVRTIVKLAHQLNMDVVAEGVETATQRSQLQAMQCEFGQGYYFSRPIDAEAGEALLADSRRKEAAVKSQSLVP
jgi:diguanylate cyclase (GGDEF)-like protein/PAS domain S-box-containing protein